MIDTIFFISFNNTLFHTKTYAMNNLKKYDCLFFPGSMHDQ